MSIFYCGLFSVLLPVMMELAANYKNSSSGKKCLLSAVGVAVAANAVAVPFWLLFKDRVTGFEFLLVSCAVAVVLVWFVLPLVRTGKLDHIQVLKTVCFGSIVIALYSILTFGQASIHSDTATATLLVNSQIADASLFPAGWNYANGDIWLLNQSLVTFPFVALMENQSLARMLGSVVYVLIVVCGVIYHSKAGFKNGAWLILIPLFLIFACYNFGTYNSSSDVTLYQAAGTGHMLWNSLYCLFVFKFRTEEPAKKRYYLLFCALSVALSLGGIRALAEQTMPFLLAYAVLICTELMEKKYESWKKALVEVGHTLILVVLPAVVGLGIHKIISASHNMNPSAQSALELVGSFCEIWSNIVTAATNIFICFGFETGVPLLSLTGIRNLVSVTVCILVVLVVPFLQLLKWKREDRYTRLFFLYGMAHNAAMLMIIVLFTGKYLPHYVLTSIYMWCAISARYIYVYWIRHVDFRKFVWTALFVIAAAVECMAMLAAGRGWDVELASRKSFNQQFLDRGLTKGYATYWNSYKNEIYSDLQIRYGSVNVYTDALEAYRWLVHDDVFIPDADKSFLLLSEEEQQIIGGNLIARFGTPAEYFVSDGLHVYIFNYDIAENFGW